MCSYKAPVTYLNVITSDPTFISNFLITQKSRETNQEYLARFIEKCLKTDKKGVFFLAGLRSRWLARETYAALVFYKLKSFRSIVDNAGCIARTVRTNLDGNRSDTPYSWIQRRPFLPVWRIDVLRHYLRGTDPTGNELPPVLYWPNC